MCDFSDLYKIEDLRNSHGKEIPTEQGVYKWWCCKELLWEILKKLNKPFDDVKDVLETKDNRYCFYVGQTKNNKGLRKRIKGQHLSKSSKPSTLRRSMESLFGDEIDNKLNTCYVQWVVLNKTQIDDIENKLINGEFIRVLNIKGVKREGIKSELVDTLQKLRKEKFNKEQTKDGKEKKKSVSCNK